MCCSEYHVEELEYKSEEADSSQAWVPLRIVKPVSALSRLPVIIYLHATGARTLYTASQGAPESHNLTKV